MIHRPMLPNPYVLADQIVDLRAICDLSRTDRAVYKATQVVIDWLENIPLDSRMAGSAKAGQAGVVLRA